MKNNKILHNMPQELTAAEKTQAKENVGIIRIQYKNRSTMSDEDFEKLINNFEDTKMVASYANESATYLPTVKTADGYHFNMVDETNMLVDYFIVGYDKKIISKQVPFAVGDYIEVQANKTTSDITLTIPPRKTWVGVATFTFNLTGDKNSCYLQFRDNTSGPFGPVLYLNGQANRRYTMSIGFLHRNNTDNDLPIYMNRNGIEISDMDSVVFTGIQV